MVAVVAGAGVFVAPGVAPVAAAVVFGWVGVVVGGGFAGVAGGDAFDPALDPGQRPIGGDHPDDFVGFRVGPGDGAVDAACGGDSAVGFHVVVVAA